MSQNCKSEQLWTSPTNPPAGPIQLVNDCLLWIRQQATSVVNGAKFSANFSPYILPTTKYLKIYNISARSTDASPAILITISRQGDNETAFLTSANDVTKLEGYLLALIAGPSSPFSNLTNTVIVGQAAAFGTPISWPLIVPAGMQINAFVLCAAVAKPCTLDIIGILVDDLHDPSLRGDV